MTMTGLALGLGGLIAARRRRASNTASWLFASERSA